MYRALAIALVPFRAHLHVALARFACKGQIHAARTASSRHGRRRAAACVERVDQSRDLASVRSLNTAALRRFASDYARGEHPLAASTLLSSWRISSMRPRPTRRNCSLSAIWISTSLPSTEPGTRRAPKNGSNICFHPSRRRLCPSSPPCAP